MLIKETSKKLKRTVKKGNKFPYISRNSGILGGIPIISGTRIAVRAIAGYYQLGMNVDEILITLKHLTPSQVHSALAYYFDHQNEIDKQLKENSKYSGSKNSI
ncbi:MAG TPA: DUF433 domain-containing protein [Ignavibacteria bacterium]|nr:DUF433 domain-containing protein [Ignavibacteria bacterium]